MDNFLPFSSNSNVNSLPEELSMDCDYNPSLYTTIPTYDQPQPQPLMFPYAYAVEQTPVMNPHEAFPQIPAMQTGIEFGSFVSNPGLMFERGGFHDPHMKKMARNNRKLAMLRSRNNPSPSSSANEMLETRKQVTLTLMKKKDEPIVDKKDLFIYSSFDNKSLRVLLMKHLKNSDVGALGRIVLPKREAERNLPELTDKEGIIVKMRNVDSIQSWTFKYKFWCNNKSRMYVLENTGDFVRDNGAEIGDYLTIYEDESKNLYFSIRKSEQQNEGRENYWREVNEMKQYEEMIFDYMIPRDEEEASIAMLIGDLNNDQYYPIPNDLMGLTLDHQATSSSQPVDHVHIPHNVGSSYDHVTLDDSQW